MRNIPTLQAVLLLQLPDTMQSHMQDLDSYVHGDNKAYSLAEVVVCFNQVHVLMTQLNQFPLPHIQHLRHLRQFLSTGTHYHWQSQPAAWIIVHCTIIVTTIHSRSYAFLGYSICLSVMWMNWRRFGVAATPLDTSTVTPRWAQLVARLWEWCFGMYPVTQASSPVCEMSTGCWPRSSGSGSGKVGNHRSGTTLASSHASLTLWYIDLWAQWPKEIYTPLHFSKVFDSPL